MCRVCPQYLNVFQYWQNVYQYLKYIVTWLNITKWQSKVFAFCLNISLIVHNTWVRFDQPFSSWYKLQKPRLEFGTWQERWQEKLHDIERPPTWYIFTFFEQFKVKHIFSYFFSLFSCSAITYLTSFNYLYEDSFCFPRETSPNTCLSTVFILPAKRRFPVHLIVYRDFSLTETGMSLSMPLG